MWLKRWLKVRRRRAGCAQPPRILRYGGLRTGKTGVTSLPTYAVKRKPIVQPGGEDMNVDVEPRRSRWSRFLLLAGGIGLAWCAVTTFGQSSSASAADDESGGLLGVVSSTVQHTTSAAASIIDTVDSTVTGAVQGLANAAIPPAPAPAPQAPAPTPVVAPVIHGVVNAATSAVSGVTHTATSAIHGTADTADVVTGTVADVASSVLSSASISQALAPVLAAVDGLPVLGTVTSELGVTETVVSAVDVVDGLLTAVTGTATTIVGNPGQPSTGGILPLPDGLLPGDPTQPIPVVSQSTATASLTAQQALIFGGLFVGALVVGSIVPVVGASSTGSPRAPGWPLTPAGSAGAPVAISSAAAGAASLWAALIEHSWRTRALNCATLFLSNDALPGAPVFATDVSPD